MDLVKKDLLHTTKATVELDSSAECAACEAIATAFDNSLNNMLNIDDLDMIELCDEIEIIHKNQVSTTIFIVIVCIFRYYVAHKIGFITKK